MGKWFPLKDELLYDYSIKARTKKVLAILYHHKNNSSIVKTTHANLDKWTGISNSKRYLNELINFGYVEKIKDGEYKLKYRVNFQDKKKSEISKKDYEHVERYTKIEYDHIFNYNPEDVINYYIITNILRMNKFDPSDINKIDVKILLSSKNDKSPWNTIEEVNDVINNLKEKEMLNYEITLQCLIRVPDEDGEDDDIIKTAPEEQEAVLDKVVSDNIIQNSGNKITNELEDFFGKERAEQLIVIAKKNEIEITLENLSILHNYKTKAQKNDTAEGLVDYFYQKSGQPNTFKNTIKYVEKIKKLIQSKGFIKTRFLVEYAIEIRNVNTLNFVDTLYEQAHSYILNKIRDEIDLTKAECSTIAMSLKDLRPKAEQIKQQYGEQSEQYKEIKNQYNLKYNEFKTTEEKLNLLEHLLKGGD